MTIVSKTLAPLKRARAAATTALLFAATMPAFAQVGGGTGTMAATSARTMGILTEAQGWLFGAGALIISCTLLWCAYGIAFGAKKWGELGRPLGAGIIAGMTPMLVGWLFA